jgi:hypothetical protein
MKLELRKVSWSKALSEETPAYSAQVWIDGKYFCDVSNHGTGGCDCQYPPKGMTNSAFQPLLAAMDARIKAEFPAETFKASGDDFTIEQSLESLCQKELYRQDLVKSVKRDLAKKVMFVRGNNVYSVKIPKPAPQGFDLDRLIAAVKTKNGVEKTINEMTLDEAVAVFEKAAA